MVREADVGGGGGTMRRAMLAGVAVVGLCGPAEACPFSATEFRSIFDRTIAPKAGLAPVSEYDCRQENGADFCSMVTPGTLEFTVENAPAIHQASLLVMTFEHAPPRAALDVIYAEVAALCSPSVPAPDRAAALAHAEADTASGTDGHRAIIGDVSYRFTGGGSLRVKDRQLPNLRGVNTSDDE